MVLCTAGDCEHVAHVLCIAPLFTSSSELLPEAGHCPRCDTRIIWGELIRGCFARKEGSEAEQQDIQKALERALKKGRRKKVDVIEESSSQAISELSLESPTKRSKSAK
jgi:hypothetical protein